MGPNTARRGQQRAAEKLGRLLAPVGEVDVLRQPALDFQDGLVQPRLLGQDSDLDFRDLRIQSGGVAGADVGVLGAAELLHVITSSLSLMY